MIFFFSMINSVTDRNNGEYAARHFFLVFCAGRFSAEIGGASDERNLDRPGAMGKSQGRSSR